MTITDHVGRSLKLDTLPRRIISLVPSQTELLVSLGLEDRLVGVTKFCVHPNYIRNVCEVVGGTKTIKLDKIRGLQPDIIFCNKEENTYEMILELETIAPVHVSNIVTIEDSFDLIKDYGKILGVKTIANNLVQSINSERLNFKKKYPNSLKKKVAYLIWKDPWMVAANDTFIHSMINEIGFTNVFESKSRYPEVEIQDECFREVDYVLLSSEPFPFKEKHLSIVKEKNPQAEVVLVNGEFFSWFGSRILFSYNYFGMLFENIKKTTEL